MRIEIYSENSKAPEEVLTLRLQKVKYGEQIQLIAVDPATGRRLDCGVLIEFFEDGTFKRAGGAKAPGIDGKIEERR